MKMGLNLCKARVPHELFKQSLCDISITRKKVLHGRLFSIKG